MNEITATVTSKGQITLPKTVREILSINTEDEIIFSIQPNKEVIVKKKNKSINKTFNLINLLLKTGVVVITGGSGTGKTTLAANILKYCFNDKRIGIIEPFHEISALIKNDIENIEVFNTANIQVDNACLHNFDVIVIDESQYFSKLDFIKDIKSKGIKVLLIKQKVTDKDTLEIGEHFNITANRLHNESIEEISEVSIQNQTVIKELIV